MLQKPVSNTRAVQCINNATFLVDIVRIEPIFLIKFSFGCIVLVLVINSNGDTTTRFNCLYWTTY